MASLSNLNDQQNLLLTQLSYHSDVLKDNYNGMTLEEIASSITGTRKDDKAAKKVIQQLCDAGLKNLRIKDVGNDSITGFGAIAFTDESGNTGFSFRGTDGVELKSINDWGDNLISMLTGTSPQSSQAEVFFDRNSKGTDDIYLYGHSKGGELAEYVYVNNHKKIKGVHLLNPQPINPFSLSPEQLKAMQSDKVDIVIVEGDYVWFLGSLASYGNIRIAKSNGGNAHVYSSISDMYDNYGNIIQGNMPWWEYPAYLGIAGVTMGLQIIGGATCFVYNCVVSAIDYIKNDLYQDAKEFIASVCDRLEKIDAKLRDFANKAKQYLGEVISKAQNWFKSVIKSISKSISVPQQIKVDTYKLTTYASRLSKVNRRINTLDGRLDRLYWQVGLQGLWNLLQADLLTGYSWRLNRCQSYLNTTANNFNTVENKLKSSL